MADKYWWEEDEKQTVKPVASKSNTQAEKKYWWEEDSNQGSSNSFWWEDGTVANTIGADITNRVNNWLKNHNSYISDYQKRYEGRKYTYEDAYVSDSAAWLDHITKSKNSSYEEANAILSYMDQYKDYLDADWVSKVRQTIVSAKGVQSKMLEGATNDSEFWAKFNPNEDQVAAGYTAEKLYGEWQADSKQYADDQVFDLEAGVVELEALKRDRDAWLADQEEKRKQAQSEESFWDSLGRWLGTTPDTTIPLAGATDVISSQRPTNEYDKRIAELEDQIERAKYVQGYEGYMANMDAEDYSANSQYVSTRTDVAMDDARWGVGGVYYDEGKLFGDIDYDYINRHPDALTARGRNDTESGSYFVGADEGYLKTMSDDEIGVYNYLYKTQGKESANAFKDFIESDLQGRRRVLDQAFWAAQAKEDPVGSSVFSTFISPLKGASYVGQVADMLDDGKLDKNAGYNRFSYIPSTIRSQVSTTIERSGNWGKVGSFAYNTGMSMADFLLTTAVSGGNQAMSLAIMGTGAAADATIAAKERGLEDWQAFTLGTIAGIAEVAMEKISLGAWLDGDMSEGALKYILKNAFSEAGEEAGTSAVNLLADVMISGDKSEWKVAMQKYMDEGKSAQEAFGLVAAEQAAQIGLDALGGFLSGSVIGGGTYMGASIGSAIKYGGIAKSKAFAQKLTAEGIELNPDNQYVQKMKSKVEKGKNLTGMQVRNILAANQEQITANDMKKIQQAAEKRLTDLGETNDASKLAEIATKWATGQEITRAERKLLTHSEYGSRVAHDLLQDSVVEEVNSEGYGSKAIRSVLGKMASMEHPNAYKSLESRMEGETPAKVSDTGKAVIRATGKEVDLTSPKIKSISKDSVVLEVDGKDVNIDDIDFANDDQWNMFNALIKVEHITPLVASDFVAKVDMSKPLWDQLNGMDEAFTYGFYNYSEADLNAGLFTSNLTKEQLNDAYKLGQYERGKSDLDSDAPAVKMRTEADAKLNAEQKTAKQKAKIEAKDVEVYFEDGKSVVKFDEHNKKYDAKRTAAVNTAKFLSKLGIGGKYYFFESYMKDGVRVYKDADGNEVEAPNGIYKDADGSIHIDLNAGEDGQGTALFTMGHELTHFIKAQSKKQFKVLGDLVKEAFDKTELSMHERVLEKQSFLESKRGKKVSYDEAYEEVVADAMSTMISDGSFYDKLMEIKVKDKGLFNTIKRFFQKMIAKFNKAYAELTPDQRDARDIRAMKDMFDKIQTAFVEGLVEASDNFQASEQALAEAGIAVSEETDSGSLLSVRDVLNEKDRKKVAQALADRFNVTEKEAMEWLKAETSLASIILNPKYSAFLDYEADPNEVAIKQNSDYPQGTVDFSNICKKRREFTQVMNRILRNFPNHVFAATDLAKIRTIMGEEGMTLPCGICYVEDRRQLDTIVAQDFIDGLKLYREGSKTRPDGKPFNANQIKGLQLTDGDTYVPTIYELVTLEGRNSLKEKNPNMEAAWIKYNNARGMQAVRLLTNEAEYKRQILKYTPKTVQTKNDYGGLRIYSFSDAEMFHLIDIIQVLTDCAAVGLKVQGYTKVNEYAKAVKDTGEKLNRSLIPLGDLGYHMENGKVVLDYDPVEGIDVNSEDFFDSKDNPDVGNIVIGINPTQIRAAMVSDFIDYIIPFHTGQSAEVLGEKGIAAWVNYKDAQSEIDLATGKKSSHQINIYTEVFQAAEDEGKPIRNKRDFVNKFLAVCKENGLKPRFAEFLNMDANGDYVYTEGYHKLLVDFKTFAQTEFGEYLPQNPVKPIFDNSYITGLLEDYVKEQQVKDAEVAKQMPKVIDRITNEIVKPAKDVYLHSDRKTFKNGQNANGVFVANVLIDLADSNSKWWTGAYNHAIFSMSKIDDTEFTQFHQEIEKRTKDMEEYGEAGNHIVEDSFTVQDGNGKEYIYVVKLDGYLHGVVLEKIDKAKYAAALQRVTKGGTHGKSLANIKRRTGTNRSGLGSYPFSDGRNRTSDGNPGHGRLGSRSSQSHMAGTDEGEGSANRTVPDVTAHRDFLADDQLKGNYSVSEISEMFDAWNSDPELTDLSKKVFAKLQEIMDGQKKSSWATPYPIRFKSDSYLQKEYYIAPNGIFEPSRSDGNYGITYNLDYFRKTPDQDKARVLLHEAIHACTVGVIKSTERRIPKNADPMLFNSLDGWSEEQKAALELIQVFSQVRVANERNEYGQKNVYEMVAEMSNPEFRAMLKKQNLWGRIVDAIKRIFGIEQRTAYDAVSSSLEKILELNYGHHEETAELSDVGTKFSVRQEAPPKKVGIAYKVFLAKDGQLYPPMVANPNGEGTPVGVWLNADIGKAAAPSKTGRPQVQGGGKGTNSGKISLAFRPGWHLGDIPLAKQFAKLNPETGKKELFPANFVWAECEYAMDVDYQEEAMSYGYTENGKFRHSYAGLPKLPENGYYRYRTNPNPDTVPWVITGAMRVKRILTDAETDAICRANGVEPMARQGGEINLADFGLTAGDTTVGTKSSERGDGTSNRSLLANAFEGITKSSVEYKLIQEYKGRIKLLNEYEEKLAELNAEIRKILFDPDTDRDAKKLKGLQDEAKKVAENINRNDKKLLSLEASEPLRKVIERERKKEAQKTKDHVKEIQQNKKVRAEQTELRHKIRKTIRDLDKILNRGNKKLNVKEDMQDIVSKALKSADILFTDNYGSYDMLRNGIGADMSDAEEALVDSCTKMLKDLDKMPTDGYDNWQARQEAEKRLKTKMSKLNEVFARERKRLNSATVSSILGELADAYAKLEESEQSYVQGAYSEPVHNFLKNLQSEVGGTIVKDMTKDQLESVYAAYKMVLNTVRNANKMFNEELKQSREQLGNAVINEVLKAGGVHLLGTKLGDTISQFDWNNMKPIWLANRIGSDTFGKLMQGLFKGQYDFAVDIDEVRKFKLSMDEKYRPRDWDAKKLYEFESSTGKKFNLNLQQVMSLYAFSKREQAYSHLLNGGFVFEDNSTVVVDGKLGIKKTYIHKGATSYKLNEATLNDIINSLTAEQKAYVDEMQAYLSDVMGAKGNEVSMKLYGIQMYKEKFYFPLRSSGAYMEKAKEAELKKEQGQINLVNSGFTHSVKPQAKNPIILSGFMDVWSEHCNEMSMYHSMVLPMEDFRKVYNYSTIHDENMDSASVYQTIQDAYGKEATSYIDQLYRELNAGATVDPRETPYKKLISNFKKAAVMLSGSVVVQQFSSIGRAFAVIDPKYFIGAKVNSGTQLSVVEEMKKYAPVAIIKEMGGFDTGTRGNAKSYITAEKYGKGERIKGFLKDKQYRGDIMGLAPQWADEKTWCAIWEATKRETKAKHPDMDVKSDEFLNLAGERFSEVIEKTQVYDSVLARSANMRSKGNFMAMATAFMAEPTTAVNLIEDAIRSGKAKNIARAFGSVAVAIVLNNALASIVYAMRDDDEDETFIEKYFQSFTSGMIDDINPMTYYPFLKDVWSLFQGYDVERADMSVIADVRDALKKVVSLLGKDTSEMDDDELAEHYKKVNEVLMGLLDAGCSMFGVPVKNVRREVMGIINAWNTIGHDITGESNASWSGFWDKVGAAAKDTIPIYAWTKDKAKTDKLYDAIVSGDKDYLARLKSTYKSDDAYHSAVRKALRENDSRIHDAAQARYEGNSEEYKRIFREIQNEGKFSFDDIMSAINSEESAIKGELEPDKVTSDYTASGYVDAIIVGNMGDAEAMKEDIIATKMANGKTQAEAEKEFISSVTAGIRDKFHAGLLDEAGAKNLLLEYADKDEEEAASKVSHWSFCDENPQYDYFTESNVEDYREFAEPADISLEVFAQYINGTKGLETKYDEWGDVEVSKRDQVLEVIDSLDLTWQQKDALYLAAGYAESKIWDVPW